MAAGTVDDGFARRKLELDRAGLNFLIDDRYNNFVLDFVFVDLLLLALHILDVLVAFRLFLLSCDILCTFCLIVFDLFCLIHAFYMRFWLKLDLCCL